MPLPFASVDVDNDSDEDILDVDVFSTVDGHTFPPEPTAQVMGLPGGVDVQRPVNNVQYETRAVRFVLRRSGVPFGSFEVSRYDEGGPIGVIVQSKIVYARTQGSPSWQVSLSATDENNAKATRTFQGVL